MKIRLFYFVKFSDRLNGNYSKVILYSELVKVASEGTETIQW